MTRGIQKQDELRFSREAARLMDLRWKFVARDESDGGPDFIVYEGTRAFWLEVHEIFSGEMSPKKGSRSKQIQAETQKRINEIRRRYEEMEQNVTLYAKFLGTLKNFDMALVVNALVSMGLRETNFPHCEELELRHKLSQLKIFVRRLPDGWPRDRLSRPDWFGVMDSVGWVEQGTRKILDAVTTKSEKIGQYRRNIAAHLNLGDLEDTDVRLLVVADRMWSYGQIAPGAELMGNLQGFDAVYFFPFPEKPITLKSA